MNVRKWLEDRHTRNVERAKNVPRSGAVSTKVSNETRQGPLGATKGDQRPNTCPDGYDAAEVRLWGAGL
jgi:hypothetical protein